MAYLKCQHLKYTDILLWFLMSTALCFSFQGHYLSISVSLWLALSQLSQFQKSYYEEHPEDNKIY